MTREELVRLHTKVLELETHQKKLGAYDANAEHIALNYEIHRMTIEHLIEVIPKDEYRGDEEYEGK